MLIAIIIVAAFLSLVAIAVQLERRDWNGGISPAGERWRCFDTDSQGGRLYKDSAGNHCCISYPWVD